MKKKTVSFHFVSVYQQKNIQKHQFRFSRRTTTKNCETSLKTTRYFSIHILEVVIIQPTACFTAVSLIFFSFCYGKIFNRYKHMRKQKKKQKHLCTLATNRITFCFAQFQLKFGIFSEQENKRTFDCAHIFRGYWKVCQNAQSLFARDACTILRYLHFLPCETAGNEAVRKTLYALRTYHWPPQIK